MKQPCTEDFYCNSVCNDTNAQFTVLCNVTCTLLEAILSGTGITLLCDYTYIYVYIYIQYMCNHTHILCIINIIAIHVLTQQTVTDALSREHQ